MTNIFFSKKFFIFKRLIVKDKVNYFIFVSFYYYYLITLRSLYIYI